MGQSQSKRLETAVKEEKWKKVHSLLKKSNYNSSVLKQFIAACEENDTVYVDSEILSHCTSQQWNRLLETAVKKERWDEVKVLLKDSNYSKSGVEQFITACEQCGVIHVDEEILFCCSKEQVDRLLTLATTLKRWVVVGRLLKAGDSHEKRVWAVEQACHASDGWRYILPHVDEDLLSHCNTQQLDTLLTTFATRNEWPIVGKVLKAGGSQEKRVWAIEQASRTLSEERFYEYMPCINNALLSQCSTQQLDLLLTTFTTEGQWQLADKVLTTGCSHEKRYWAITQACRQVHYHWFLSHITVDFLNNCNTKLLDSLLTKVTTFKRWDIIDKVLKAGGSHGKRVWVIKEVCETADHLVFQRYISPHCDDELYNPIFNNPQTQSRRTVLFSAMLNEHCPQRMVGECIRLGFSTHQPPSVLATSAGIRNAVCGLNLLHWRTRAACISITSPFLLAVLRDMPVVAHMLYESGSSSYPELLHLYTLLLDLTDLDTEEGLQFLTEWQRRDSFGLYSEQYKAFMNTLTTFLPSLKEMASTPRSLESSCRLVISHCLTVGGGRDRAVQELPLPDGLKDYLLFSDLTDPDYQPQMY